MKNYHISKQLIQLLTKLEKKNVLKTLVIGETLK